MSAKNYRKRSLFEEVMAKIKRCSFFAPQCIFTTYDSARGMTSIIQKWLDK